jgi:hypothetical protein
MLYKYRGLSNLKFALDIFVNERLHAADYKSLNDPMEGQYTLENGTLAPWQIEDIFSQKNEYRMVALSESSNNLLMWSYYGESHSGMVVGVDVLDAEADTVPIDYVENLNLEIGHDAVAKRILSKKYVLWQHEREHRVFVRKPFIEVKVNELVFGVGTEKEVQSLVTSIAKKFCPDVKVSQLTKDQLDCSGIANAKQMNH